MTISDVEIKSKQPTRAVTAGKLAAAVGRGIDRPRCIWAGMPGSLPDTDSVWDARNYRERWLQTVVGAGVRVGGMLEEGEEYVDFVVEVAGLYEREAASMRTMDGTPADENVVVLGGVALQCEIHQYQGAATPAVVSQLFDDAHELDFHRPDWLGNHFQAVAGRGLDVGSHSLVYREGLTLLEDTTTRVQATLAVDPADIDYSRPVQLECYVRPYGSSDSGLADRPRWHEDAPVDELAADDDDEPDRNYMRAWMLGLSAWAR